MAHIFTRHDSLHIHAILGALALIHFVIRWVLILCTGRAFPSEESKLLSVASVLIHSLLPLVSLGLPVPRNRNFSKPMIWPEFRAHSLLFASRHVISCCIALLYPGMSDAVFLVIGMTLHQITMTAASWVTICIGDPESRTTNTMPYPKTIEEEQVNLTRLMYRDAQFFASAMMLCRNPTICFMPLLAIQIAPFLMTLVRKNLTGPAFYHGTYAWALWLNILGVMSLLWRSTHGIDEDGVRDQVVFCLLAFKFTTYVRVQRRLNKHLAWLVGPLGSLLAIKACEAVSSRFIEGNLMWVPKLSCPRYYWLMARLGRSAILKCLDNQHVMLPHLSKHSYQNYYAQRFAGWVHCVLGTSCDLVLALGMLLKFGVIFINSRSGAQ